MPEVFVSRSANIAPGFDVAVALGQSSKLKKGEIGIEIEVEGTNVPKEVPKPWLYKEDHSLRGEENGEYVLDDPVMFSEVPKTLDKLWTTFGKAKTKFDDSNRTSVHIHLNCQKFHFNRLTSFMALYFALEEVLTEWCGEHRVGNLFCLRSRDAEAIITHIKRFICSDGLYELPNDLHYAGLNANALHKYGSLEIRTLQGCSDPNVIQTWGGGI
jgi:hypothetical protein